MLCIIMQQVSPEAKWAWKTASVCGVNCSNAKIGETTSTQENGRNWGLITTWSDQSVIYESKLWANIANLGRVTYWGHFLLNKIQIYQRKDIKILMSVF